MSLLAWFIAGHVLALLSAALFLIDIWSDE